MSKKVREWLKRLGYYFNLTHEERLEIDRLIGAITGTECDEALRLGMISEEKFREIVEAILKKLTGSSDRFSEQRKKAKEIWKVA